MRMEHFILLLMWLFGFIGFILFVPKKDWRKGFLAFMMFHAIIWLCDMPAFKYDLLRAPVRELPKAADLPLTIDYFFYPVLFSIFYVHRRVNGSPGSRITYFLVWVSAASLLDIVIERYTDLLEYEFLTWYGMWMYIGFLFYISQVCCNWFFKDKAKFLGGAVGNE